MQRVKRASSAPRMSKARARKMVKGARRGVAGAQKTLTREKMSETRAHERVKKASTRLGRFQRSLANARVREKKCDPPQSAKRRQR